MRCWKKREDPQKLVRLMIQEMEDTLVRRFAELARAFSVKRNAGSVVTGYVQQAEWQESGTGLCAKDKDDLARAPH